MTKLRADGPGPGLDVLRSTEREYFIALGKRIKRLRQQHGLAQYELARLLDVSQQTVFAYEGGHRRLRLDMVPTLMTVLRVECEVLLGLKPLASLPSPETRVSLLVIRLAEEINQLAKDDKRIIMRLVEALRG
jgi:transcriptional regulator with XRE-family HTH domain